MSSSTPLLGRLRRGARKVHAHATRMLHGLPTITLSDLLGSPDIAIEPAILDDVTMPPFHEIYRHDDFVPLMKLVRSTQPRLVIELGTAYGNLTANMCRQCPELRALTVNAPAAEQSGNVVTYELTADEIGRVYRAYGYGDRIEQIFCNTLELDLSRYTAERYADLAIIDACHDRAYVLNDFFKVEPYVKPGGLVFFHDTHPSMEGHLIGSYMACTVLRRRGFDVRHLQDTWWGVWRKP